MIKKTLFTVAFVIAALIIIFSFKRNVLADDIRDVTDEEFGAVPNDEGDDYQAIQNALNKSPASPSETVVVKIPEGKYYISRALLINSNTVIEAEGAEIYALDESVKEMIFAIGEDNIVIDGGVWDIQSSPSSFTQTISLRRGNNITIQNAELKNATNHFLNISASHNVLISNCIFKDVVEYDGSDPDYCREDVEVIHTDFAGEGEESLQPADGRACQDITVENCVFSNVYSGIGNHHSSSVSRSIRVKVLNCTFDNILFTCMYGISFDEFEFSGNVCRNVGTMFISDDCSQGVISGNTLELPDQSAEYQLTMPPVDISDSQDVEITDNTFEALDLESILLNNDEDFEISGNIIKKPTSSYLGMTKRSIQLNSCRNCTVSNNQIDSAVKSAIYIYKGENVTASDNTILNCGSESPLIIMEGKNHKLNSNTVVTDTDYALCVYDSTNALVSGNTVKDSDVKSAIYSNNSTVKISSNVIKNTAISEYGIFCNNSSSEIIGNSVNSYAERSIYCYAGNSALIKDNNISGNPYYGICVNEVVSSTISNNTISASQYRGIQLYIGTSLIENNTVNSSNTGIYINGSSNSRTATATVKLNTINSPRATGDQWIFGLCLAKYARNCQLIENSYGPGGFGYDSDATYTVAKGRWTQSNNKWYYYDYEGKLVKGWKKIEGYWYFLDRSTGAMQTGWLKDGGQWYYMHASGAMETGWEEINGKWYFFDRSSGVMQTGWLKDGGQWYYMHASGAMETGWEEINGIWYFFDRSSGVMQTDWKTIDGTQYYFKGSGAMAASEWVEGFWWLGSSGAWTYQYRGSWHLDSNGWWFGDESGWYAKDESIVIKDVTYNFDQNGYIY